MRAVTKEQETALLKLAAKEMGRKGGKIGGRSRSPAKVAASRRNAKKGGRKRKYPPCSRYRAHHFSKLTGRCPCGYLKPEEKGETQ